METNIKRLNPLLAVTAASLIVLSAVGVAALTGVIPSSKGQTNELRLPAEIAQPIAPAIGIGSILRWPYSARSSDSVIADDMAKLPAPPSSSWTGRRC